VSPRRLRRIPRGRAEGSIRRGVAILPSLFTVGSMFLGYYAIILGSKHQFETAVTLIIVAGVLDSLDGRIARMMGAASEFGKELDSLSDFLSFGLAPAIVLYFWGFKDLGRTGWLFAFLLPIAGAMRLARFNVQAQVADKRFFVGLPIPAAAAAAVLPLYYLPPGLTNVVDPSVLRMVQVACLVYVVGLSWLMVSRVRYRSFKDLDLRAPRSSILVFFIALLLILVAINPPAILLAMAVAYALSGPASWLWGKVRRRKVAAKETQEAVPGKEPSHEP
jgi:CDP-diacylglycerol--serine O-phosphatidyltransferase